MEEKLSPLESFVKEYNAAGLAWVNAKLVVDQLDDDLPSFLAALMNELDDGEMAEAKMKRLALGDKKYRDQVNATALARAEMLRKKVRYESLDRLFEAKRSNLSFEKEKMRFLPHTP